MTQDSKDYLRLVRDNFVLSDYYFFDKSGRTKLDFIKQSQSEGFSIILGRMQEYWTPLSKLVIAIEEELLSKNKKLKSKVNANTYFTPPNSTGFKCHCDAEEIIILQVEGSKHWIIYEPLNKSPMESIAAVNTNEVGNCVFDGFLKEGEALHIPRGYPHLVNTTDSHSLHITLSYNWFTWLDLISTL